MSTPVILVCDDTPAKRYVLASWLRRAGYDVVETDTIAGATEALRCQRIDLAVLDVHLPDGSGLDVTRALRADVGARSTPVVHVSAVAMETADKVVALDEGADAYLVDPIEPEELLSTVRALLRSSGARREAELLATRLERLGRAAVRLNAAASVPRLVEAVARAASEVLDGSATAILVDDEGQGWRVTAAAGDQGATATAVPAALVGELLAEPGSWTVCPVDGDGGAHGVVAVPTSADPDEREQGELLLQRLAQSTAVAVDNLRALAYEHRTALMLQRSLLPASLPEPAGLRLAARYRASQQQAEVGGDFFDAFEVDGHCVLVIGDVQGHSLEAAVVMAELRYSLRAYAYDGHDPTAVLDRLDAVLDRGGSELIATACIVRIAPDRASFEVVCGGHPAPLLVRDGTARELEARGPLLGAQMGTHPATSYDLRPGDRLLLFTDGLVERRGERLDVNLDRVAAQAAASTSTTADGLADELLVTWGASEDDVALLVVDRVEGQPA